MREKIVDFFEKLDDIKIEKRQLMPALIILEILGILVLVWYLRDPLTQKYLTVRAETYSVVRMNTLQRYLLSQGDFITGKAIPNTKVKVLLTPGTAKKTVDVNDKGEWVVEIPKDADPKRYRLTVANFDKQKKLASVKGYKIRLLSNNNVLQFVNKISTNVKSLFNRTFERPANAQENVSALLPFDFSPDFYNSLGLPSPTNPKKFKADEVYRWNTYILPQLARVSELTGADVGLMGMWIYKENEFASFLDNCLDGRKEFGPDADFDQNTVCTGWTGRDRKTGVDAMNWQVGLGVFPSKWWQRVPEAIEIMHPGESLAQIGNRVIEQSYDIQRYSNAVKFVPPNDPITYPSSFPEDVTIDQILEGAQPIDGISNQDPKDPYMRQLLGILMKDEAVGSYILGLFWREIMDTGNVLAELNSRYPGGLYENGRDMINIVAGIHNLGTNYSYIERPVDIIIVSAEMKPQNEIDIFTVVSDNGVQIDSDRYKITVGTDESFNIDGAEDCGTVCTVNLGDFNSCKTLTAYLSDKYTGAVVSSDSIEVCPGDSSEDQLPPQETDNLSAAEEEQILAPSEILYEESSNEGKSLESVDAEIQAE